MILPILLARRTAWLLRCQPPGRVLDSPGWTLAR
jgi:hypothetical protein